MHASSPGSRPGLGEYYSRCKNLATLEIVNLCLSYETVKAVGPFYLVSMPGEVKDPTRGYMCNLSWTPHSNLEKDNSLKNHSCVSPKMGCLEYTN